MKFIFIVNSQTISNKLSAKTKKLSKITAEKVMSFDQLNVQERKFYNESILKPQLFLFAIKERFCT